MFKQNISFEVWGGDAGKYRLRDNENNPIENTPEETCDRVAKSLSDIESQNKEVWKNQFRSILGIKFAGGGRIMANAGAEKYKKETSPINCTVMRQIPDSLSGIMDVAKEAALTLKAGCGVGYDFSTIRPKGAHVFGAGSSTSGVISFMKIFDTICSTIMSGGSRRGAQMGCLDISSPDIEDFITAKEQDGVLRYFNCSVLITDDFMNAVVENKDWDLWFWEKQYEKVNVSENEIKVIRKNDIPYSHLNYQYFKFANDHNEVLYKNCIMEDLFKKRVYRTVKAKYLFDLITKSTYNFWEPGFILIDRMNKENNLYWCETIRCTNPCQPGWATLLTPNGITTMNSVKTGDIIWSGQRWTKITNKVCTGEKDVYAFKTRAGTFYGTENHRVVSNGEKIEAKDADSIDISYVCASSRDDYDKDQFNMNIIDGLLIGDGMIHKASNNKILLCIGDNDQDYFKSEIASLIIEDRSTISKKAWSVQTNLNHTELPRTYNRQVPDRYKFGDFHTRRAFLRGLYSANGSIVNNRVTLKSSSPHLVEDVQQMLSSLGIPSYFTVNKAHEVEFENGIYECKESYDLSIGTLNGRSLFNQHIGFIHDYKMEKLAKTLNTKPASKPDKLTYDIVDKEYIGKESVYDITVEANEHTYWTGGLCVSNCGEQPLHPLTSCLLGSMILPPYVKNAFENPVFDFEQLAKDVRIANRLLDNVVEINNLPLKEMQESILEKRRHGLGFTGLGSVLNMMKVSYGSPDSIKFAEKIMLIIAQQSLLENILLAKEKEPALIFKDLKNREAVLQSNYLKRLLNSFENKKELIADILKYGLRYSHATSLAPTGTMSISWGNNCSNGVEPVFDNSYMRNIRDQNKKTKTQEEVFDYSFFLWKEMFGNKLLPKYWRTTADLKVIDHLNIQAAVQKWCDSSISKTINIPENYSFEDFQKVYLEGWKLGLKGLTTYRPNPNISSGVLTHKNMLEKTEYCFKLEDGSEITLNGNDNVEYDGELHNVANLFDALKEGIYGNM